MNPGYALSAFVTSEDGAQGHKVVVALVSELLKQVVEGARTHRIDFKPRPRALVALSANKWKSRNPIDEPQIRLLASAIASEIMELG